MRTNIRKEKYVICNNKAYIFGIAFTISFFFIRKSHLVYKRRCSIVAFAATVILTTISALIPIENAFVTFSSPKSAYNYNHSASVELIVDGNESDFVVGAKVRLMFMLLFRDQIMLGKLEWD